jgi:hypothetical protein
MRKGLLGRLALWIRWTTALVAIFVSDSSIALPSYAQQTGMPCNQCHSVAFGPALTPYGRQFKLNGYVWGNQFSVPLAGMILASATHTDKSQSPPPAVHFGNNDNIALDQVSGFLAGRVSEHMGAFVQATYSGVDRHTAWDNVDIRYARSFSVGSMAFVAGVSVNNNPTVQDLWNSVPAWSFPYVGSALAPSPAAAPLIAGGLSQKVVGASFYTMVNDRVYLEVGGYKGITDRWLSDAGLQPADNPHVQGVSPYWRAAVQFGSETDYFSAGLVGLSAKLKPDPMLPLTDRYADFGVDVTYQHLGTEDHSLQANVSLIHEQQRLDASFAGGSSDAASNHLNALRLDGTYAYRQTWVAGLGWFDTRGSVNAAASGASPIDGNAAGDPRSQGLIGQLEYVPFGKLSSYDRPWLNLRVGVQYVAYRRFNGARLNYDGFGRSAADNNTLFGFVWTVF